MGLSFGASGYWKYRRSKYGFESETARDFPGPESAVANYSLTATELTMGRCGERGEVKTSVVELSRLRDFIFRDSLKTSRGRTSCS
jgi:hypothetical protein